ncbi:PHB depolymerase family esterase [Nocardiopsis sp. CNT-189]|uniref:extracellular catalytic domain type 1 short-chain-length polyhydroxyalkanoate depolymerase n=1 Tax=Nocardiopsis oceanisediminis TaxID=2816862 RepID=UPI003B29F3F2
MNPRTPRIRPHPGDRAPRRRGALARRVAAGLVAAGLLAAPAPAAHAGAAGVPLEKVEDFGADPGALDMYVYRPDPLPAGAPAVVALHGCTQDARTYADNSGLAEFADRYGFLLVLPEQPIANNIRNCFNWFQAIDNRRGSGEAASIRQMAAHAVDAYGTDPERVHVTGLSAGGAMTAVMLAAYPEAFRAGAAVAGIPYGCTRDTNPFTCMNPGTDRTPEAWAQRVRDARPGYGGPWPRVAIWHGDQDTTVVPGNAGELRDQWTEVHGLGQEPDRTTAIGPGGRTVREEYLSADGSVAVEVARVSGIGHGTPVDPGQAERQCGRTGTPHFIDSICSAYWITSFFGLDGPA